MNPPEPALGFQWQHILSHLGVKKRSRRKDSLLANQEEKVIPTATTWYHLVWTRTAIPSWLFMKWKIPEYTHTQIHTAGHEWISFITNSCFTTPDVEKHYTWRSRHQEGSWHARGSACEREWGGDQKRQRQQPGCHVHLTPGKKVGRSILDHRAVYGGLSNANEESLSRTWPWVALYLLGKSPLEDPSHAHWMAVSSQWEV